MRLQCSNGHVNKFLKDLPFEVSVFYAIYATNTPALTHEPTLTHELISYDHIKSVVECDETRGATVIFYLELSRILVIKPSRLNPERVKSPPTNWAQNKVHLIITRGEVMVTVDCIVLCNNRTLDGFDHLAYLVEFLFRTFALLGRIWM